MECSCTVDCWLECDGDFEVLIQKENHKAPRECECSECGCIIMPGEPHLFRVDFLDEDHSHFSRYRQCKDCGQIADVFFTDYYLYQLWEYLEDAILNGEIGVSESCLVGLSPKNMARVCEFIESGWRCEEYQEEYQNG